MSPTCPAVLWLRRDLRRRDHPALRAALDQGRTAVVFVVDPQVFDAVSPRRRAWLARTVLQLREDLGGRLSLRYGDPVAEIPRFAGEHGATAVHVSAETTPYAHARDTAVQRALAEQDIDWCPTGSPYAVGPGLVLNKSGGPYQVFTPFARAWRDHGWPDPAASVRDPDLADASDDPRAADVLREAAETALEMELPTAGEAAAIRRLRTFLDGLADYDTARDRPDVDGTSRLSAYLRLGVLHPRTILAEVADSEAADTAGARTFVDEIAWREFYADVLWHHPASAWADLKPALAGLRYDDPGDQRDAWEAWCTGTTGYPVVDAGMRQLAATGWMHNRVRMITASFLTKDLHVWWPHGARHFLAELLDADLASNNHGWQWVAGTGTDASPYFRVFNPVEQGKRFDPDGDYVRRWVPELRHLPGKKVHEPWNHEQGYADGYPLRIVDHAEERREALNRYEAR